MIKSILLTFLLLTSLVGWTQAEFEKGYFINNEGTRTECLIKNKAWKKSPAEFVYQLTETTPKVTVNAIEVKELGINGGYRFISEEVEIDMSSDDEKSLSDQKDPIWSKQRVFLKVLVDGEASLFEYQNSSIVRFFYRVNKSALKQLVFKKYLPNPNEKYLISTNLFFRQQLWTEVYYPGVTIESIGKMSYDKSELLNYFIRYNEHNRKPYNIYTRKKEKMAFHLRVTPGINSSYISIDNSYSPIFSFDFGRQWGFRMGIEPELIIPYTNNTLGLVVEPTFQYYTGSKSNGPQTMYIHLYTIEFPIGIRYYFFLNKRLTVFLNAFFIPGPTIHPNSYVQGEDFNDLTVNMTSSFAAGAGMTWKRYGFAFRYYTNRHFIEGSQYLTSRYTRWSIILGFRIF